MRVCEKNLSAELVRLREVGLRMLEMLEEAILLGGVAVEHQWIFGDKETALSAWTKISAGVMKIREIEEELVGGGKAAVDVAVMLEEDLAILKDWEGRLLKEVARD